MEQDQLIQYIEKSASANIEKHPALKRTSFSAGIAKGIEQIRGGEPIKTGDPNADMLINGILNKYNKPSTITLQSPKVRPVKDFQEQVNSGYISSENSPFKPSNDTIFNQIKQSAIDALTRVKKEDVIWQNFKGDKNEIDGYLNTLNGLDTYNEANYNTLMGILAQVGIDPSSLESRFQPVVEDEDEDVYTREDDYGLTDGQLKSYKNNGYYYVSNANDDNYGKILYDEKWYDDLAQLGDKTEDPNLINKIINDINSTTKFESYDLTKPGLYDLDFEDEGTYFDATGVLSADGYDHILIKRDNLNNYDWQQRPDVYGVKNGKIDKLNSDQVSYNRYGNLSYDTTQFNKLLNFRPIADEDFDKNSFLESLSVLQIPGLLNNKYITPDGELSQVLTHGIARAFGRDTTSAAALVDFYLNNPNYIGYHLPDKTEEELFKFYQKLYQVANNKQKQEILKKMNLLNKHRNGGIIKAETGTSVEADGNVSSQLYDMQKQQEEDAKGNWAESMVTGIGNAALYSKNWKTRALAALAKAIAGMYSESTKENPNYAVPAVDIATDALAVVAPSAANKWSKEQGWRKYLNNIAEWTPDVNAAIDVIQQTTKDGVQLSDLWSIIGGVGRLKRGFGKNANTAQPATAAASTTAKPATKKTTTKNAKASSNTAKTPTKKTTTKKANTEELEAVLISTDRFGGKLSYLTIF